MDVGEEGQVEVWQTFRGNEWDNKGERVGAGSGVVEVKVVGHKGFYEIREGCMCSLSSRGGFEGVVEMTVLTSWVMISFSAELSQESYDSDWDAWNGHGFWDALFVGEQ